MVSFVRLLLLFLMLFFLPSAPLLASEHGGGGHDESAKKEEAPPDPFSVGETVTGGAFEGDPVYVHMKPIIFPIISDYGAEQIVTMIVDLEVKDVKTATLINGARPRLKDSIIRALYGGLSDGKMRNASMVDIPQIKVKILDTVNQTFGAGSVTDVLIQAVAQRKL